jgi:WD40 repeat protein
MELQNSPPTPELEPELRLTKLQKLYDAIFGYDFFISYAHEDGKPYALELSKQLAESRFICFLDSSDFAKGENWKEAGLRALHKTSRLVLIGTPAALVSPHVLLEIRIFAKLNRHIIAIDMGGAIAALNAEAAPELIQYLSPDKVHIREAAEWSTGKLSRSVIQELRSTIQLMRQRDNRIRWLTYAASILLILTIVAAGMAAYAFFQSNHAQRKTEAAQISEKEEKKAKLKAIDKEEEAKQEAWKAKHQRAMNHIGGANAEIDKGSLAAGIFRYWQAFEAADDEDPLKRSARSLLASWSSEFGVRLIHPDAKHTRLSPDGIRALTGGNFREGRENSNYAMLWDVRTGMPIGKPLAHSGPIMSAEFNSTGKAVVTGSKDKTARVWDAQVGAPVAKLEHEEWVIDVAINSTGDYVLTVAVSTDESAVSLWNVEANKRILTLPKQVTHTLPLFSPDGKSFCTRNLDNSVQMYDTMTGKKTGIVFVVAPSPSAIAFAPDGQTVLVSYKDKSARLFSATSGRIIWERQGVAEFEIRSLEFSPSGEFVVGLGSDNHLQWLNARNGHQLFPVGNRESGLVRFSPKRSVIAFVSDGQPGVERWDISTNRQRFPPAVLKSQLRDLTFGADGKWIVALRTDLGARLYSEDSGPALIPPLIHSGPLYDAKFSLDGRTIIASTDRRDLQMWDSGTGRNIVSSWDWKGDMKSVELSPDGQTIVGKNAKGELSLWNAKAGTQIGTAFSTLTPCSRLGFSPDGLKLITICEGNKAWLWDVQTGRIVDSPLQHPAPILCHAFSPDGCCVATGCDDRFVRFWDVKTGREIGSPMLQPEAITCLDIGRQSQVLATACDDGKVWLRDRRDTALLCEPLLHKSRVFRVEISPEGSAVVTLSVDNAARLWDVKTGQLISDKLSPDGNCVLGAEFSPNGQYVMTCGNQYARLWDVRTGLALGPPLVHEKFVGCMNFSSDGRKVLTGSIDKTVCIWNIVPPAKDNSNQLRLSVEVRTGICLDENNRQSTLTLSQWLDRREQLDKLGGFCDVRSWDDLTEAEKLELRTPPNKR